MAKSGYELSRIWFDWAFENPEKINPNHAALYFFCIEHCNRLGWKEKFGLPSSMAKDAIGIKSYNTYIKTLRDLVDWGFLIMVQVSKNQYTSNIVALSYFNKAVDKALDKATLKHITKHSESIDSINKPINHKPINHESNTHALQNSNLFRQPNIPTYELVLEVFTRAGGNEEMAKKFFDTNSSVNWFFKGSPITNFANLVPGYIESWKKNNQNGTHKQINGTPKTGKSAGANKLLEQLKDELKSIGRGSDDY